MSRQLGIVLAWALVSGLATRCDGQANLADVIERCEKSVVRIAVQQIDGSKSEGSGFVVAPNTIATNVHVLMGAKEASATFLTASVSRSWARAGWTARSRHCHCPHRR